MHNAQLKQSLCLNSQSGDGSLIESKKGLEKISKPLIMHYAL